jgi:hypothetical protein
MGKLNYENFIICALQVTELKRVKCVGFSAPLRSMRNAHFSIKPEGKRPP